MRRKLITFMIALSVALPTLAFAQNNVRVNLDPEKQSYIVSMLEGGALFNGEFKAWCINNSIPISPDVDYTYKFYSGLRSNFPDQIIEKPQYMKNVNWLINQDFVGKESPNAHGTYTYGDVQVALWTLVNNEFTPDASVDPWDQFRVNEIVNAAMKNGSRFIPTCKQKVAIIIAPVDENGVKAQTLIIEVKKNYFKKCVVPDSGV